MAGSGSASLRAGDVVLRVEDLVVDYPLDDGDTLRAVDRISFDVRRGETVSLVGESGCGKSTTARAILQLPSPSGGSVQLDGGEITGLSKADTRAMRQRMQMVFQNPIASLNPRRRVRDIVGEGLAIRSGKRLGTGERTRVDEVLEAVGLDPEAAGPRRPHEFSGGQCQRISIARALVMDPEILVCDEPVSALDVSVQAQILNLIEDMKERYSLTIVFISHDLSVVKNVSDRVVVMYLGKICEVGPVDQVFHAPAHPYTRILIDSMPEVEPDGRAALIPGDVPSPLNPPSGCRFRTRCPRADDRCRDEAPVVREHGPDHFVACHHADVPVDLGPRPATA